MLVRTLLLGLQRTLFLGGLLALGYCGFALADAQWFQHQEKERFANLLTEPQAPLVPAIGPDGLIGRVDIPSLALSVIIVEGTSAHALRRAAGHIVGTSLPGQSGNVGISAHRDTFFRPLRNIQNNDIVTLTTLRGEYRYRVVSTKVVSSNDIEVLNSDGSEILTLVTCYPFYFVGPAPSRFIVRAERVT
jgi:sortase A